LEIPLAEVEIKKSGNPFKDDAEVLLLVVVCDLKGAGIAYCFLLVVYLHTTAIITERPFE
jgi:hypothetical protein